jgi:hypothetical protein
MMLSPTLQIAAAALSLAFSAAEPPASDPGDDDDGGQEQQSLREMVEQLKDEVDALKQKIKQQEELPIRRSVTVNVGGYVDFGFFVPQGDGAGFVQDYSNQVFPQYKGQYAWVFLGDILSTAVNSRGEVADLGNPPGVMRFDSIHSKGAPGFILNESNLTLRVGFIERAILTTSVNFVPRTGSNFSLGDFFDLDLAQLEWVVAEDPNTSIFIGKIDPAFGIEYKQRKANQRFGITPSLAARYTTGTQLGLKARTKLFDGILILAGALTNGNSTIEMFHFYDEIDSNAGKTVTGRAALHFAFDDGGVLEIGGSGEVGPQDRARDGTGLFWLAGADIEYSRAGFALRAEALKGKAPGSDIDQAYGLNLHGAGYLELNWMFLPMLGVLARGEIRDAFVFLSNQRAYVTKSWRATGGLRWVITENFILKAEYLHNGEYGAIPQIKNDVFTSSFIMQF